ncbi:MAG: class III poly(R)-hydroxyalkanoic acid synthase subunit PhaE [Magnetococcales bacterium]|nr:class III poly(R)-hydroxyalkanoic acid synthase subunit PhaE [Magnetococcales bacterium]
MDKNPFSTDWMTGWNDLQKKIWEDWSDVTQNSWAKNFQTDNPMNFFREGMSRWPGISSPQTPEAAAMRHAMSAMESFMRMGREVFKTFQNLPEGVNPGSEWTSQLDKIIQNAKELFTKSGNSFLGGLNPMGNMGNMGNNEDLAALWNRPMKAWNDFLTTNPAFSNDIMRSMLTGQSMEEMMNKFLSMPGLGYNREKQEKMQEGMRLGLEYRKASEEFQVFMTKANNRALDLLHRKLLELAAENKPLQTMRDLYVLWVDCSEEANAEAVTSKEFNALNARMMNALVRVRQHMGGMVDDGLATMNMPTRRELDSAHKQITSLRRRVQALEDEIQELRAKDTTADLNALRDDMEKLGVRRLREELAEVKKQFQESLHAAPLDSPTDGATERSAIKKPVRAGNRPQTASAQKGE